MYLYGTSAMAYHERQLFRYSMSLLLQVWSTSSGEELLTLEGHKNVVSEIILKQVQVHASVENMSALCDTSSPCARRSLLHMCRSSVHGHHIKGLGFRDTLNPNTEP
jgi:hypothetical protein